jgi:EAL domain-containing protein (putative c-di-GMP-specific phosphodiesterase class I)
MPVHRRADRPRAATGRAPFELRRALEQQELRVYYQPVHDLPTSRLIGVEALVRWQHPERGLVSPASSFPIAERTG